MEKFSINSAFTHFMKHEGPKGFLWKYFLGYLLVSFALYAIAGFAIFSVMQPMFAFMTSNPAEPDITIIFSMMFRMLGVMALFLPVYLVFASVFEASALRRYIRKEGFSLSFGNDEFRVMGVMTGLVCILDTALPDHCSAHVSRISGTD